MLSSLNDSIFDIVMSFRLGEGIQEDLCLYSQSDKVSPTLVRRSSLPKKIPNSKRIVIVSDTHERHQCLGDLPSGDIFVHAGDLLMVNSRVSHRAGIQKLTEFNDWLGSVNCTTRVVISGNHDKVIETLGPEGTQAVLSHAAYLENTYITVDDITIWGTPVSAGRSQNKAFQSRDFFTQTRQAAYAMSGVDILVTHGPHFEFADILHPSMHIWGHSHSYHGIREAGQYLWQQPLSCLSVNASIMDRKYNPSQFPVVIDYVSTP